MLKIYRTPPIKNPGYANGTVNLKPPIQLAFWSHSLLLVQFALCLSYVYWISHRRSVISTFLSLRAKHRTGCWYKKERTNNHIQLNALIDFCTFKLCLEIFLHINRQWFQLIACAIHMCRWHAAPTQAQVRFHWTAWRSDLSSVNYRRSCLSCCWSKGVEWPAQRCYDGLVAVSVQDRLKTYMFRRCYETVWL